MSERTFEMWADKICKVDDEMGVVFGWAIICKIDGEPYFDTQGDHITEEAMLKASLDFILSGAEAKEMHKGDPDGDITYRFPLTDSIKKAMGIESKLTGFMVGYKPASAEILAKFRDGTYTGFSIGGRVLESSDA
jgi:hypothetical protein